MTDKHEWFEIEYTTDEPGYNDWYSCNLTADTIEGLRKLAKSNPKIDGFTYRFVRKTITTEPISL